MTIAEDLTCKMSKVGLSQFKSKLLFTFFAFEKKMFTVIAPECLTFFMFHVKNLPSNTFNYCWLMMGGQSVWDLHFVAHGKYKYEDIFLLFDL